MHYNSVGKEAWNIGVEGVGTGFQLWCRMEVLKSFILKVRLTTPLIHVGATAEEERAEFMLDAGCPCPAAQTY